MIRLHTQFLFSFLLIKTLDSVDWTTFEELKYKYFTNASIEYVFAFTKIEQKSIKLAIKFITNQPIHWIE